VRLFGDVPPAAAPASAASAAAAADEFTGFDFSALSGRAVDVFSLLGPRGGKAVIADMDTPNAGGATTFSEDAGEGAAAASAAAAKQRAAAAAGGEGGAGDKPWQTRVAAVEVRSSEHCAASLAPVSTPSPIPSSQAVTAALDAHIAGFGGPLAPSESLSLLAKALARRLPDSSGPIKQRAAAALASLATAAGPTACASHVIRHVVPGLIEQLRDSKAVVAAAAARALEALVTEPPPPGAPTPAPQGAPPRPTVPACFQAVLTIIASQGSLSPGGGGTGTGGAAISAAASSATREALLAYCARHAAAVPRNGVTIPPYSTVLPAVLAALSDRLPAVREGGRTFLVHVARMVGPAAVKSALASTGAAPAGSAAEKAVTAALAEAAALAAAPTPRLALPVAGGGGVTPTTSGAPTPTHASNSGYSSEAGSESARGGDSSRAGHQGQGGSARGGGGLGATTKRPPQASSSYGQLPPRPQAGAAGGPGHPQQQQPQPSAKQRRPSAASSVDSASSGGGGGGGGSTAAAASSQQQLLATARSTGGGGSAAAAASALLQHGAVAGYSLHEAAPGAREARARAFNRARFSQDVSGSADAQDRFAGALAHVSAELKAAGGVASPPLLADMFAPGSTGPDKQEKALRWLAAAAGGVLPPSQQHDGAATPVSVASCVDLLLKYAAVILMDPR
jgi:hypothetical protein